MRNRLSWSRNRFSSSGRVRMSSRWISIRARQPGVCSFATACVAFTSEDLPIPRAPQSIALLAGNPLAKRRVFSTRMDFWRSTPFSKPISTRETTGTGAREAGTGCQTNASAAERSKAAGGGGAKRSRAPAIRVKRSNVVCSIRARVPGADWAKVPEKAAA